ncbi:helix-turn-helix domain-containing protein [Thermoanaerobacterium sp. DL9XJH110]|uniref:helix-turn-helix domain-containing protein n=1 Tax=Thermoanaerobacterium sp. DL9XJH110 TaxID=3386643 RepID=UPI003BB580FF
MIGQKIKQLRQQKKISQYELGKRTKIFNQSQISKIENNERYLKAEELKVIADALEVAVTELLEKSA